MSNWFQGWWCTFYYRLVHHFESSFCLEGFIWIPQCSSMQWPPVAPPAFLRSTKRGRLALPSCSPAWMEPMWNPFISARGPFPQQPWKTRVRSQIERRNFAFDLYSTVLSFVTDTAVFCCGLLQDYLITQTCVWFCCLYMMLISPGEDAFSNKSWSCWPRAKLSLLAEL